MEQPQENADERRFNEQPVEKAGQSVEETKEPETALEKEKTPEPKEIIAALIDKLDTGRGISYSLVVEASQNAGINPESVESGIKELMAEGRCYEPRIGVLRKV